MSKVEDTQAEPRADVPEPTLQADQKAADAPASESGAAASTDQPKAQPEVEKQPEAAASSDAGKGAAAAGETSAAAKPDAADAPKPSVAARVVSPPAKAPPSRLRAFAEKNGSMAAGVILALGVGWVVGANTFDDSARTKQIVAALQTLDGKVEAIAAAAAAREDVAKLNAGAEQVKVGLDATRNNVAAAVAQLTTKIDRLERDLTARQDKFEKDAAQRLERMTERVDRVEKAAGAAQPTATAPLVQPPATPAQPTLGGRQPPRSEETSVPQTSVEARANGAPGRVPSNGYVLRGVQNDVALVEGRSGLREVLPGDMLPGAGRVRSIERRGRQWVVVTSNGVIDAEGY